MKILWKRGEIAPKDQFLLFSTIFCCLLVDLCVITGTRFSLRDKRLFEISEFEITRVDCIIMNCIIASFRSWINYSVIFCVDIFFCFFLCFTKKIAITLWASANYKSLPFDYVITFKIQPKNVSFYFIC